jgi:hypothetical protein
MVSIELSTGCGGLAPSIGLVGNSRNLVEKARKMGVLRRVGGTKMVQNFRWICKPLILSGKYGGQGRNRTADASLFRAALYQLSYLARVYGYTRKASEVGP